MQLITSGGSKAVATSKMECFEVTVNSWKLLTIITKHFILDVAAVLDPSLITVKMLLIYESVLNVASKLFFIVNLYLCWLILYMELEYK